MLTLFRRHLQSCPKTSRTYRRCSCPIYVEGSLAGEHIKKSLDLTSWTAAVKLIRGWEDAGRIGAELQTVPTIEGAVERYLEAKRKKFLAEATICKLTSIFEKQLLGWTKKRGLVYLRELTPARLAEWVLTWKDQALAASKKHQRVIGFFYFCIRMKWLSDHPMKALDPPKVRQKPTLPFAKEEVNALVSACESYPIKGIYGEGNRQRLRAMVLLLRYSGLRIRDAVTLRREKISDGKLLLYMQKTGVPVFVPLPDFVVDALAEVPNVHPSYFFWSGNGLPKTAVADWQRSFRTLCDLAEVQGGHFHRLRDTFAIELLLAGVPLDQVSLLLGHSSIKITERSYAPFVKARQEQLEESVRKAWNPPISLRVIKGGAA